MSPAPSLVALTTDVVLFSRREGTLCVLLVERGNEPYRGKWALPGGFVEHDEDLLEGALRELAEETGIDLSGEGAHALVEPGLIQIATYGRPGRDPRGRTVSVVYGALGIDLPEPMGADDAADARWWTIEAVAGNGFHAGSRLAFDHDEILADARARLADVLAERSGRGT
jgi:8-oxo-dGTP diphosphatase